MSEGEKEKDIPEEFHKIINDMINDIVTTFPEYSGIIQKWWDVSLDKNEKTKMVFDHCIRVFPERFFDILYKNIEIFDVNNDTNTEFLPGIVFKHLWNCEGVSDTTKDIIWKYLQLVLFSVVGSVNNTDNFGDTAKLFEAINEEELKTKLQETLDSMSKMFEEQKSNDNNNNGTSGEGEDPINLGDLPDVDQLHEHINKMMGGKLGKLAMELAEETAKDFNLDMDNTTDTQSAFQGLFKNPGKLMNMVKNIGGKIDEKLKSGELKESEIMEEGMELLNKMKSMPGMGNMQQMFSQMGIPGFSKNTKMNMGAMESQMNQTLKMAKMKERMKTRVDAKQNKSDQTATPTTPSISEEEIIKVFSTGETVERTPRGSKPQSQPSSGNKKKKSKK